MRPLSWRFSWCEWWTSFLRLARKYEDGGQFWTCFRTAPEYNERKRACIYTRTEGRSVFSHIEPSYRLDAFYFSIAHQKLSRHYLWFLRLWPLVVGWFIQPPSSGESHLFYFDYFFLTLLGSFTGWSRPASILWIWRSHSLNLEWTHPIERIAIFSIAIFIWYTPSERIFVFIQIQYCICSILERTLLSERILVFIQIQYCICSILEWTRLSERVLILIQIQ